MKKYPVLFMTLALFLGFSRPGWTLEGQTGSVSGQVILVKPATNQILLAFKKPGALIETIAPFSVNSQTQMRNLSNIAELKINDSITVSYMEDETGNFIAKEVAKEQPVPAPAPEPATGQS